MRLVLLLILLPLLGPACGGRGPGSSPPPNASSSAARASVEVKAGVFPPPFELGDYPVTWKLRRGVSNLWLQRTVWSGDRLVAQADFTVRTYIPNSSTGGNIDRWLRSTFPSSFNNAFTFSPPVLDETSTHTHVSYSAMSAEDIVADVDYRLDYYITLDAIVEVSSSLSARAAHDGLREQLEQELARIRQSLRIHGVN